MKFLTRKIFDLVLVFLSSASRFLQFVSLSFIRIFSILWLNGLQHCCRQFFFFNDIISSPSFLSSEKLLSSSRSVIAFENKSDPIYFVLLWRTLNDGSSHENQDRHEGHKAWSSSKFLVLTSIVIRQIVADFMPFESFLFCIVCLPSDWKCKEMIDMKWTCECHVELCWIG